MIPSSIVKYFVFIFTRIPRRMKLSKRDFQRIGEIWESLLLILCTRVLLSFRKHFSHLYAGIVAEFTVLVCCKHLLMLFWNGTSKSKTFLAKKILLQTSWWSADLTHSSYSSSSSIHRQSQTSRARAFELTRARAFRANVFRWEGVAALETAQTTTAKHGQARPDTTYESPTFWRAPTAIPFDNMRIRFQITSTFTSF